MKSLLAVVEVTRSLSDIIKSNFISFSDQKRAIKTVDKNDPNVLKSSLKMGHQQKGQSNQRLSLDDLGINPSTMGKPTNVNIDNGQRRMVTSNERDKVHVEQEQQIEEPEAQEESLSLSEEQLIEIETLKEEGRNQGYEEGFTSGKTDGYNLGFEEGKTQAELEVNKALEAYGAEQENVINELKQQLVDEYAGYKEELEPKMLSIIEELVIKIIGVQKTSKGTIMHLIKCGLDELELHGDLVIKVSSKDLDYVIERKQELTEELSEKIIVEILKDQQLEENECIIETEMGTIDCSLGTQLDGLLKELRLIKDSLLVD